MLPTAEFGSLAIILNEKNQMSSSIPYSALVFNSTSVS